MPRTLPEEFFTDDRFQKLLANIVQDPELFPEIRNGSLTVYYRGAALIRDLRVVAGKILGQVHYKYIPVCRPEPSAYATLELGETGFSLANRVAPLELGFAEPDCLSEYKRVMASVSHDLECRIIHEIVCRPENRILDQEIKFQLPGIPETDKIDICHFDTVSHCLAFVEVKGIHDSRLQARGDAIPEVVQQLRRYQERLESHRESILEDYRNVVALKRRLGLGTRLNDVPEDGPSGMLSKPVLVIGDCSAADVQDFKNSSDRWIPLLDGLKGVAAGLILCGSGGCRLSLEPAARNMIEFDLTIV